MRPVVCVNMPSGSSVSTGDVLRARYRARKVYKEDEAGTLAVASGIQLETIHQSQHLRRLSRLIMDNMKVVSFLLLITVVSVYGFGSDDKFIKKYAMMKIYESCFGSDVVKQIRKDMKQACAKCAAQEAVQSTPIVPHYQDNLVRPQPSNEQTKNGPLPSTYSLPTELPENDINTQTKPNFDPNKLHQAILAYRPNPFQSTFRPFPNAGFYPGYASPGPMFYPPNPQGFQSPLPYTPAFPQYPFFQPQFYGNQRMSRDMDIKSQLEILTSRMSGRVRNVTCVMQELGYLDENLEPNYEQIQAKVKSLNIQDELKADIQEGIAFCQQFSQCVPEVKKEKSPLSSELIKPMFFFRCYKHKKLEACIMKDVRERFNGDTDDFDSTNEPDLAIHRTGKSKKAEDDHTMDELATSVYDFLYGSDDMNVDSIL